LRFDLPVKIRRGAMVIVRQALASTGFHQIAGGSFAEQMPMNAGIGIVQLLNAIPGECSATQCIRTMLRSHEEIRRSINRVAPCIREAKRKCHSAEAKASADNEWRCKRL